MIRRTLTIVIAMALVLGLTACSEDSDQATSGRQTELLGPEDVASIVPDDRPASHSFALEVADGIAPEVIDVLLDKLPARTLSGAEFVAIDKAPADLGTGFVVVAGWREQVGIRSEVWLVVPDKVAMEPLLTLEQTSAGNGRLLSGFSTELATLTDGIAVQTGGDKAISPTICAVLGFIDHHICPVISMYPPGAIACAAVSAFLGIYC